MSNKHKLVYLYGRDDETGKDTLLRVFGGESDRASGFFDARIRRGPNIGKTLELSIPIPPEDDPLERDDSGRYVHNGEYFLVYDRKGRPHAFAVEISDDVHEGDQALYRRFECDEIGVYETNREFVHEFHPETGQEDYRLYFYQSDPFSAFQRVLANSRWSLGKWETEKTEAKTFWVYYMSTAEALKKLVEKWDLEIEFRIEHNGNEIVGRYVDVYDRMGKDNGVQAIFGVNMSSVKRTFDTTDVVTSLIGQGKSEEQATDPEQTEEPEDPNAEETDPSRTLRINFAEIEWSKANGDPVDKPKGQEWVGIEDPEVLRVWGFSNGDGTYSHTRGLVVFDDETDRERLLERTWEELLNRIKGALSYELSLVDLSRFAGYEHFEVNDGDVIRCIDRAFSWDLTIETRVIEIEEPIGGDEEDIKVKLGVEVPDLAIVLENQQKVVDNTVKRGDSIDWLEGAIDLSARRILGASSYVYIGEVQQYPGIYIPNAPAEEFGGEPTGAMYLSSQGLLISSQKEGGSWKWTTAIDAYGINASVINAGTVNAELVNIRSTGNDREIFLRNGYVRSYWSNRETMRFGGYWLGIFDHGFFMANPYTGEVGTFGLIWNYSNSSSDMDLRGVGINVIKDVVGIGFQTSPDTGQGFKWDTVFYSNRKGSTRSDGSRYLYTHLIGPPTESTNDYAQMILFADRRPLKQGLAGGIYDGPGIRIHKGIFTPGDTSSRLADVQVYIGDAETNPDKERFQVFVQRGEVNGSRTFDRLFEINAADQRIYLGPSHDGIRLAPYLDYTTNSIDNYGAIRLRAGAGGETYIYLGAGGSGSGNYGRIHFRVWDGTPNSLLVATLDSKNGLMAYDPNAGNLRKVAFQT